VGIPSTLEDVQPAALTAVLDGRWAELRREVRAQLAVAEAELRDRINERWMRRGVTMWDPERTYVDAEVHLEADVSLLPPR